MTGYTCPTCHATNLRTAHRGMVDCLTFYRDAYVELARQLPQGTNVLQCPLSRETRVSIWIEGPCTAKAFDKLHRYVDYLRDVYISDTEDEPAPSATEDAKEADATSSADLSGVENI